MTEKDWIINIETIAESICSEMGSESVVRAVFEYYGAESIEGISPSYYPDVFGDLQQIEADLS